MFCPRSQKQDADIVSLSILSPSFLEGGTQIERAKSAALVPPMAEDRLPGLFSHALGLALCKILSKLVWVQSPHFSLPGS